MPESTSSASENSLEGFGVHLKGDIAASTRQELPLREPRGIPCPFAALRACMKAMSNGGNLKKKKQHIVPIIPRPGFQMGVRGDEARGSC